MCITSQRVMMAFLQGRDKAGGPSAYLSSTSSSLYIAKIAVYTASTMVGDCFMVKITSYLMGDNI